MRAILLSAAYMNKRVVLKFYDPELKKLILWRDNTGHKPHCYISTNDREDVKGLAGIVSTENVNIFDILQDKEIKVTKVIADNPLILGGTPTSLKESHKTWESDIKYYQSYLYDNNLIVGKWYDVGEEIKEIGSENKFDTSKISTDGVIDVERFKQYLNDWTALLSEEIPKIKRMAFDIEVETERDKLPDPLSAPNKVTAIGFDGDDISKVFILKRDEIELGEKVEDLNYKFFDSEKELIEEAFKIIDQYPMVLTFNGDSFDMPYLYNRAVKLGIKYIPLRMMQKNATLVHGIHIDLYPVFSNISLKAYAFNAKYVKNSLDAVSEAMLGEKKTEYDGDLNDIPLFLLGKYCLNDCKLTYKLTSYNNDLVMNLLIILSRIANMTIDDINRRRISAWIKSMFSFNHRKNNEIIPRRDDFPEIHASTVADIKDRKYKGAVVLDQEKGIHFDVTVMDFASLYPSIVKTKNLSYETVCCKHEECKENMIPQTKHWACTRKSGIAALIIGSLKELRVNHFKPLTKVGSKEDKERYDMITQALKVYLNASYGVMGAETFDFYYLPMAESITSYGRDIILDTADTAKRKGMRVIAGDTDSIFIHKPTKEQIDSLISETGIKHAIDLEVDKEYRYIILSGRKKNYFGIKKSGEFDIKGLTGKKSHTPIFLKNLFDSILEELRVIEKIEQFDPAKETIVELIRNTVKNFDDIPLNELAFNVRLSRNFDQYTTNPQHIKAARQLEKKPVSGEFVRFVKTWNGEGVKPIQVVKESDIDKVKYEDTIKGTLQQITDPMDLDFDWILGRGKETQLSDFF